MAAPGGAVGPVDLHHDLTLGGKEAGQGGAVDTVPSTPQATGSPNPRAQARRRW